MQILDLILLIVYLVSISLVGLYFVNKKFTFRKYTLGDKKFSDFTLIATITVTLIGGNSILGVSEQVTKVGWIFFIVCMGDVISKVIVSIFLVPKISKYKSALTIGDLMFDQYGYIGKGLVGVGAVSLSFFLCKLIFFISYQFAFIFPT